MAAVQHVPRLLNKVAIVTGAASGLGRAISLAYASHGARLVVCADLEPQPKLGHDTNSEPTHDLINRLYGRDKAAFVRADVGDSLTMKDVVARAVGSGGRLDV